jgi:aldehyde dehydrogenase (NAD+)
MKPSFPMVDLANTQRFYIGGAWVEPATSALTAAEETYPRFALAAKDDMLSAIASARRAYDEGPWPRMRAAERAEFLRQIAAGIRDQQTLMAQLWSIDAGSVLTCAHEAIRGAAAVYESFADLADAFPSEEPALVTHGHGTRVSLARQPAGVVGAIILPRSPVLLTSVKLASALLSGSTVVMNAAPECPATINLLAEIVDSIMFPPGVLNMLTAERAVAEVLVNDPRIDQLEIANQKVVRFSGAS